MEKYDLQTFHKAIELANSGKKEIANDLFERLLEIYRSDSSLLLWYAFTTNNLSEAARAISMAQSYDPTNQAIVQAQQWLATQSAKASTVATAINISQASQQALALLPPKLRAMTVENLKPHEEIVQIIRPNVWKYASANFAFFFLFLGALLFLVGLSSLYFSFTVDRQNGVGAGVLYNLILPLVFIIAGLFNFGAVYRACYNANNIGYILTGWRILIVSGGWPTEVKSFTRVEVKPYNLRVVERSKGFGDLIFATRINKLGSEGLKKAARTYIKVSLLTRGIVTSSKEQIIGTLGDLGIEEIGFIGIPQVRQVEQLFLQTLAVESATTTP